MQAALIEGGAVEWLVDTLSDAHSLTPYTQEYAAALLMNLTLRSAGRARCHPLGPSILPALTHLLATVPSHVSRQPRKLKSIRSDFVSHGKTKLG